MNDKKDSSLFSKLFNRDADTNETTESNDRLLIECLHHLSSVGEGRNKLVDNEIASFKKMIKIGATVKDLKNQVSTICTTLTQSAATPGNDKLIKLFKLMPAEILINEFLEQPISSNIKIKLQNYLKGLNKETRAVTIIPDLIVLLEPEILTEISSKQEEVNQTTTFLGQSEIRDITSPLLQLFTQIELSPDQDEGLKQIHSSTTTMTDIKELCVFIEEISQLILSFISNSNGKFESFLVQLKCRLEVVSTCITKGQETNQAISDCGDDFSQCINDEVTQLQDKLTNLSEIENLEDTISLSLESILKGVTKFDNERKTLENDATSRIADLTHELDQTRTETDHLKDNLQEQRIRALTDPLTKLPNRHAYNERLHLEYNRWRRYKKPLSLIMGDIDLFKEINDTYGHIAGDTALKNTAAIIQNEIRTTDFVARYGGEEFVILMPETTLTEATKATNKIRLAIQNNEIHEGSSDFKVTISFGVANFENEDTFTDVLNRADQAMYRAKNKGRNQVCAQRK